MATWLKQQETQTYHFKSLLAMAERLGYTLIEPPYFIDYDDFRQEQPQQNPKSWIKLSNPEGRVLVLRPDLTTSVMDQLQWKQDDGPLKVAYYASTFYQTPHRLESVKEFGFEYFNAPFIEGETQIVKTLEDFTQRFQLSLIIEISHAEILKAIIAALNLNVIALETLKNIFKTKAFDQLSRWINQHSIDHHEANFISGLSKPYHSLHDVQKFLDKGLITYDFSQMIDTLKPFQSLKNYTVVFDFSGMSEWSYYDGVMFQVYEKNHPQALLKGGRYQREKMAGDAIGWALKVRDLMAVTS